MKKNLPLLVLVVFLVPAAPRTVLAAMSIFMHIDGIEGESSDSNHSGWFGVQAVSSGVSQATATTSTPDFADISVLMLTSKGTPKLLQAAANGDHFPTVEIDFNRASDQKNFYKIILTDVIVSGVKENGAADSAATFPSDLVTFKYGGIQWIYTIPGVNGNPGGTVPAGWDLKQNKKV